MLLEKEFVSRCVEAWKVDGVAVIAASSDDEKQAVDAVSTLCYS
jgi:hypothetical protein